MIPFCSCEVPSESPRTMSRSPEGWDPPRCLAPQAPFKKIQGPPALAVALRTVLRMQPGAPSRLAAPSPMATPVARPALRMPVVCQGGHRAQSASNTGL